MTTLGFAQSDFWDLLNYATTLTKCIASENNSTTRLVRVRNLRHVEIALQGKKIKIMPQHK